MFDEPSPSFPLTKVGDLLLYGYQHFPAALLSWPGSFSCLNKHMLSPLISTFSICVKLHPLSRLKIADIHLSAKSGTYLHDSNPKDTLDFLRELLSLADGETVSFEVFSDLNWRCLQIQLKCHPEDELCCLSGAAALSCKPSQETQSPQAASEPLCEVTRKRSVRRGAEQITRTTLTQPF